MTLQTFVLVGSTGGAAFLVFVFGRVFERAVDFFFDQDVRKVRCPICGQRVERWTLRTGHRCPGRLTP